MQYGGINKLARVMRATAKPGRSSSGGELDFGIITENYSLRTNMFPIPIPPSDYLVCRGATYSSNIQKITSTSEGHTHTVSIFDAQTAIKPGDRVLVAWVGDDAVVIDIIKTAEEMIDDG